MIGRGKVPGSAGNVKTLCGRGCAVLGSEVLWIGDVFGYVLFLNIFLLRQVPSQCFS